MAISGVGYSVNSGFSLSLARGAALIGVPEVQALAARIPLGNFRTTL